MLLSPVINKDSDSFFTAFDSCEGTVIALRFNNDFVSEITSGQQAGVLLDQTCFYGEAGGQIYDTGFLSKTNDEVCKYVAYVVCMYVLLHNYAVESELNLLRSRHLWLFQMPYLCTLQSLISVLITEVLLSTRPLCFPSLFQSTEFAVKNTQVRGGYVLHVGSVEGHLKVGDKVICTIDGVRNLAHPVHLHVYMCIH